MWVAQKGSDPKGRGQSSGEETQRGRIRRGYNRRGLREWGRDIARIRPSNTEERGRKGEERERESRVHIVVEVAELGGVGLPAVPVNSGLVRRGECKEGKGLG